MEFMIGMVVGVVVMLAVVALAVFRHKLRASGSHQSIRCALGFHRMSHNRLFRPTMGLCRRPHCDYRYDKNPPEVQAMIRRTGRGFGWGG